MFNGNKGNSHTSEEVERLADDASKTISELGREINHHAESAKTDMVKALYDAAKMLRKESRAAGAANDVQHRVDDVATSFEKAAGYLKRNSYREIGDDAVKTARRNPMQTMAIIFIIGVVIGLLLRGDDSADDR
jgi:ElaB/YqjD/DUF883 family membrane-anchored ribosome-binding protein